ncbi:MAG: hypothetical protein JZU65_04580 [Chlorobium sp.]|jgi:NAD(P)-dependent dehydrogenase (short-subunit alcohol dehydrogenase family)|nr:hypothetical protein [Chlorobium sp.]
MPELNIQYQQCLHLLFNNAGLGLDKSFDDATDADWRVTFDVNYFGAV